MDFDDSIAIKIEADFVILIYMNHFNPHVREEFANSYLDDDDDDNCSERYETRLIVDDDDERLIDGGWIA